MTELYETTGRELRETMVYSNAWQGIIPALANKSYFLKKDLSSDKVWLDRKRSEADETVLH